MSRWYRAYEGTVTDAKIGEAALVAGCSRSVAIAAWHCILESCCSAQRGGEFDTNPRRVAVILSEPPATIEALFAAFSEIGMVCNGAVTAWKQRQFESDTSAERSRKHRERKRNGDATLQERSATGIEETETSQGRDATPPDTDTDTDTEREKGARAEDPAHQGKAASILKDRSADVDDWELDFLHSIKWKPSLTKAQADTLKGIEAKLDAKGDSGKPHVLPSVKRGSPAYDAWIAYYRKRSGGRPTFHERQDALTVPSEFPPAEQAA